MADATAPGSNTVCAVVQFDGADHCTRADTVILIFNDSHGVTYVLDMTSLDAVRLYGAIEELFRSAEVSRRHEARRAQMGLGATDE